MNFLNQHSYLPEKQRTMISMEKTTIKENGKKIAVFVVILLALWQLSAHFAPSVSFPEVGDHGDFESWCPLADPDAMKASDDNLHPSKDFSLDASLKKQVERLSAAVNCPTESFDDNGDVDDDPRWGTFDNFHDTLKDLFPLIHGHAKLEKVNRYGLV